GYCLIHFSVSTNPAFFDETFTRYIPAGVSRAGKGTVLLPVDSKAVYSLITLPVMSVMLMVSGYGAEVYKLMFARSADGLGDNCTLLMLLFTLVTLTGSQT